MRRRVTHSLVRALRAIPDFSSFDDTTLLKIYGSSITLFYPADRVVFEKGSEGDALYVVLSGAVEIFDVEESGERSVGVRGTGGYFGELSLLRNTTHSKGARALEDSELMIIPKEPFEGLLASDPGLADYFRRLFEEREADFERDPASSSIT